MPNSTDQTSRLSPSFSGVIARYRQFLGFAVIGLLSTIIDLIVIKLLLLAHVPDLVATAGGFTAGVINGYLLNSHYVFRVNRSLSSSSKYVLVAFGGLLLTELIVGGLERSLFHFSVFPAKLVAVAIVFFWNYTLSKIWAFNTPPSL